MSESERILNDFIDAWNAGRRPRALDYLRRVEAGVERDELAGQIAAWLEVAPAPPLDAAARAAVRAEPEVDGILGRAGAAGGMWPELLPRLRERAGLSVGDVADALVERFGLASGDAPRAAGYLERMESGELEPARVSRRLLDALGELLGVSAASIAEAARLGGGMRTAAAGGPLLRSDGAVDESLLRDIEALSRAGLTPGPDPAAADELDRLFRGGPDG
jgi:transcriptional regulator with XRE-family HTH domain